MNQALSLGLAPAVSASRASTFFKIRKACAKALAFARRESVSKVGSFLKTHSVTLLVISTAAVYAGIIFGSDILTYTAAFTALGAVSLALSATKGGAK